MFRKAVAISSLCLGAAVACSGGGEPTTPPAGPPPKGSPIPASIAVTPTSASLTVGEAATFTATVRDAAGTAMSVTVSWSSSDPTVVAVGSDGTARAIAAGTGTVRATVGSLTVQASVVVQPKPAIVASVRISPATPAAITVGATTTLSAAPLDAAGNLVAGRAVTWASSDDRIATVSQAGVVAGVAAGTATISATSEGKVGTAAIVVQPVAPPDPPVSSVASLVTLSAGSTTTCGIAEAGEAYCWGANTFGQLGDGTKTRRSSPVRVPNVPAFRSIQVGGAIGCGLTADGRALCWGMPGATGTGPATSVAPVTPTEIANRRFASISIGTAVACGVTAEGAGFCWGSNEKGAVGNGKRDAVNMVSTPEPVLGGLTFSMISVGNVSACGLTTSGEAWCWGQNSVRGLLGTGTADSSYQTTPVRVAGGLKFTSISTGVHHVCALTDAGAAYCWGMATGGTFGNGTTDALPHASPERAAGGMTFRSLQAGNLSTCGLDADGKLYCWGANTWGNIGDGTNADRLSPVRVAGSASFTAVSMAGGFGTACGLDSAGKAYCWGANGFGQVGDGTQVGRNAPVAVSGGLTFALPK